jgi:hypothetical protein
LMVQYIVCETFIPDCSLPNFYSRWKTRLDEGHPLFSLFLFIVNFKQKNRPEVSPRKRNNVCGCQNIFSPLCFWSRIPYWLNNNYIPTASAKKAAKSPSSTIIAALFFFHQQTKEASRLVTTVEGASMHIYMQYSRTLRIMDLWLTENPQ